MHSGKNGLFAVLSAGILILAGGCPGVVPGSRIYQPLPKSSFVIAIQAGSQSLKRSIIILTGLRISVSSEKGFSCHLAGKGNLRLFGRPIRLNIISLSVNLPLVIC